MRGTFDKVPLKLPSKPFKQGFLAFCSSNIIFALVIVFF